jgi:radical SAM superfamily enzyme YgiQ (UPF0313 family)
MRALLVYPEFPVTYWGFQHALPIVGKRASLPPLGLVTMAALLPRDWQLELVDMNIERLTDAQLDRADVVLVGGMLVQAESMREVIRRARRRGKRTVVGGPAPSTSPESFPEADAVFGGEAEGREAELVALIVGDGPGTVAARNPQRLVPLRADARPDVRTSPVPRFDLLDLSAYASMSIQVSRGCPFNCEFCDIIEIYGRRPRVKEPGQVLAELEALRVLGWRGSLFIVDDNFIGNIREVRKLLPEIERWQVQHGRPMDLYTEASVNLAREDALVEAMLSAGFSSVFLGIETPSPEALRSAKKLQNLRLDLHEAIDRLTRAGLEVFGGFIVGFDSDDVTAIGAQLEFLAGAPIPLAMVGLLTALPGTQLSRRLASEGRLRRDSSGEQFGRPNFTPTMDEEALLGGYAELLAQVYAPESYARRCAAYLERAPRPRHRVPLRPGSIKALLRSTWYLGVLSPHRRWYWSLLAAAARRSPRHMAWAISHAVQGEHFRRYTAEHVLPRLRQAVAEVRAEALQEMQSGAAGRTAAAPLG